MKLKVKVLLSGTTGGECVPVYKMVSCGEYFECGKNLKKLNKKENVQ